MESQAVKKAISDLNHQKKKSVVDLTKIRLINELHKEGIILKMSDLTVPKLNALHTKIELNKLNEEVNAEATIGLQIDRLKHNDKLEKLVFNPSRIVTKKKSLRDRFVKSSKFGFQGFITETELRQTHGNNAKTCLEYTDRIARGKDTIYTTLKARVKKYGGLKVILKFEVRFSRKRNIKIDNVITNVTQFTDDNQRDNPWFYSDSSVLLKRDTEKEIRSAIHRMANTCQEKVETFINNGSDWVVDRIIRCAITTNAYQPGKGGNYMELPACYSNRTCTNIQNYNPKTNEQYNDCFEISILAFLHPATRDHFRYSHYKKFKGELDMTGLSSTPVEIEKKSIHKFELNNNLQINIYEASTRMKKNKDGTSTECVNPLPIYISPLELPPERQVDLLWIESPEEDGNNHFALCRDFNGMMSTFTGDKAKKYFCKRCFTYFTQQGLLDQHLQKRICLDHEAIITTLPKKGENIFEFKNFKRQQENPFRIYADFESNIEEVINLNDNEKGKTATTSTHENISFGMYLKCSVDKYTKPYEFRRRSLTDSNEDWASAFMTKLDEYADYIYDLLKVNETMVLSKKDEVNFMVATHCHICEQPIHDGLKDKVRDHDHLTGKYRGAAHKGCNLNYNHKNFKIPVIFHNLKGYDSHFIIHSLAQEEAKRNISVIANNSEKFMCMTIGRFRFIDSYAFLTSGLATLVESVGTDLNSFPSLTSNFADHTQEQHKLLIRKGIYPYEYMDSLHRFEETSLPTIEKFYSSLSQQTVPVDDYTFAQEIWTKFNCKNLGDYHDLYLKTDVLLLADVFENFIQLCLREYKLDPTHYVSLPSFSLDAGLKFTKAKTELYHEGQEEMYSMCEKGIRGGISVISGRHAEANNKYMKNYDPTIESSYIIYLDANNLYAYAMKQYLPTGNHHWEKPEEWNTEKILAMTNTQSTGAIFDVDIEYPEELHDKHNDYPFLADKRAMRFDELSITQQCMIDEKNYIQDSQKLIPNLNDKKNYIVHYRTLKQALQNGLKIKKINRVLAFNQSNWLEPYIDHNTKLRTLAKTDFQKDFYKLLNNAIYGKTLENVRGRIDYKIITSERSAKKYIRKPTFKRSNYISEEVAGIEMRKQQVTLDKPIFAGFSVLELSKELMYDFHYNTIKKRYGDKATLLMTDTDSLVYKIETEDLYTDMKEDLSRYDTSAYPKDHFLFSNDNKKVVGMFKDESNGLIIESFVGLRSKMYSTHMNCPELDLDKEGKVKKHQKGKGIPRCVMSNSINHDLYLRCLYEEDFNETVEFTSLRSKEHKVYNLKQRKTGLSAFDDKRYILEDGITTRAHGHWRNYDDLRV